MELDLSVVPRRSRRLAAAWLVLGVFALAASGLYSILIVLSRTPVLHQFIPWTDFFHTALVVHVDLSVVIWFLAFAGVIWSLCGSDNAYFFGKLALLITALGTCLIVIAPFGGESHPLMNNYIPVLRTPVFTTGLGMVGLGFSLLILRSLLTPMKLGFTDGIGVFRLGAYASVISAALAIIALVWSWQQLAQSSTDLVLDEHAYFELLFWGGGHVIQFTHTTLLLMIWMWLAQLGGATANISSKWMSVFIIAVAAPALVVLPIYLSHEVLSAQHRLLFTQLMRWGGLASLPLGLIVAWIILKPAKHSMANRPSRNALWASIILFAMGGVLAFMIEGVNVVIPAHYHGSIVGVTLAFMGLTYHLLPSLGFRPPMHRVASWQPWVYGGGQLLHILGLAWSGGYGVKRKTAGAAQGLDSLPEIAGMAMMGLGGLIAIIGGILFIVVAIKSMWPGRISQYYF